MKYVYEENGVVAHPELFPNSGIAIASVRVGDRLTLEHEKDNKFDPFAILVKWGEQPIGYVPNVGVSCEDCFVRLSSRSSKCSNCGSYYLIDKGLAWRIIQRGWLEQPYLCLVTTVNLDCKAPFRFNITCV